MAQRTFQRSHRVGNVLRVPREQLTTGTVEQEGQFYPVGILQLSENMQCPRFGLFCLFLLFSNLESQVEQGADHSEEVWKSGSSKE